MLQYGNIIFKRKLQSYEKNKLTKPTCCALVLCNPKSKKPTTIHVQLV